MDRVVISRKMIGILYMQVCTVPDATDEEILEVCNSQNKCGTTLGWANVLRENSEENQRPVPCEQEQDRVHYMVNC